MFSAAKEEGRLAQVHEALSDFAAAIEQSQDLRMVLRNPQLESSAKANILADLAGDDDVLFKNFLMLVAEKGRAGEIEEMAREFELLVAREERRLTVELTTARELTDKEAADDRRADREGCRPQGRGDAHRRPGPRRRHRADGRLVPRRREHPREIGTLETRIGQDIKETP